MFGVAVCIVVGETFLLRAIPQMAIIYLPLGLFLAAAITIIPYREYRQLQRAEPILGKQLSPDFVSTKLQSLKPELRLFALFMLGLGIPVDLALFFLPGPLLDRMLPVGFLLLVIVLFGSKFLRERKIVASYAAVFAKIVKFQKRPRRARASFYEYESPSGGFITGMGGSLPGFSLGMSVPILYSTFKPDESMPVPDFLFYRIRAEFT